MFSQGAYNYVVIPSGYSPSKFIFSMSFIIDSPFPLFELCFLLDPTIEKLLILVPRKQDRFIEGIIIF